MFTLADLGPIVFYLTSPPKWARVSFVIPPSGPEALLAGRRGQCQQVELREEGGAAGYLGGGAPI